MRALACYIIVAEMDAKFLANRIYGLLFRRRSKFKVGDTVQLAGEDSVVMIVIEIAVEIGLKEPLIHCQWFDPSAKSTRYALYRECDLKEFDWYKFPTQPTDIS